MSACAKCGCLQPRFEARPPEPCAECDRAVAAFERLARFVQRVANAEPRDFGTLRAYARRLATRDPEKMTRAECRGELRARKIDTTAATGNVLAAVRKRGL